MSSKLIFIFILAFFANVICAEDLFTVSPYIIINNDNNLLLNFQTSKDTKLTVSIEMKNKKTSSATTKTFSNIYKAIDLEKIELGALSCDTVLNYKITSEPTHLDIDRGLYAIPCDKNEPTYLGFLSDTQIKNELGQKRADVLSQTVADLKKSIPFSLIVNAGDIVQHGGREEEWLNFFNTAKVYLGDTYLLAAVGNHEYYESPTYEKAPPQFLKYLRDYYSSDLGYASIDLGKVTILMINSNFDFMTDGKIQEQFDWLEGKIKANQRINKPVIITMHHSPFSSSAEWIREIPKKIRADIVPMLEKYSVVKLMISGHLHMYERSFKKGIHYLIAGPSGGINNYVTYFNPYKVLIKPNVTTFSVIKLTNKNIEVKTFTGKKEVLDNFSISL